MFNMFIKVVVFPFVLFCALAWLIVGPFFWIPGIVRAASSLMAGVLGDAIRQEEDERSTEQLERAIRAYPEGFIYIFRVLRDNKSKKPNHQTDEGSKIDPPPQIQELLTRWKTADISVRIFLAKQILRITLEKRNSFEKFIDDIGNVFIRFLLDTLTWLALIGPLIWMIKVLGGDAPNLLPSAPTASPAEQSLSDGGASATRLQLAYAPHRIHKAPRSRLRPKVATQPGSQERTNAEPEQVEDTPTGTSNIPETEVGAGQSGE